MKAQFITNVAELNWHHALAAESASKQHTCGNPAESSTLLRYPMTSGRFSRINYSQTYLERRSVHYVSNIAVKCFNRTKQIKHCSGEVDPEAMKSQIEVVQHVFVVFRASKAIAMQSLSITSLRAQVCGRSWKSALRTSITQASFTAIQSKQVSIFLKTTYAPINQSC